MGVVEDLKTNCRRQGLNVYSMKTVGENVSCVLKQWGIRVKGPAGRVFS